MTEIVMNIERDVVTRCVCVTSPSMGTEPPVKIGNHQDMSSFL